MDSESQSAHWRRCNICKKNIPFGGVYWVCNVSTCNRKRTGLTFCDVSCWDAHLPDMNHREAWAEERKAPTREQWAKELEDEKKPKTRKPREAAAQEATPPKSEPQATGKAKVILRRSQ